MKNIIIISIITLLTLLSFSFSLTTPIDIGDNLIEEVKEKYKDGKPKLVEYYNQVPVMQFLFESAEADDIIAYIAQLKELEEAEKLIISSDKDFFQLLSSKTVQYCPIQKEALNQNSILSKFGIHHNN